MALSSSEMDVLRENYGGLKLVNGLGASSCCFVLKRSIDLGIDLLAKF